MLASAWMLKSPIMLAGKGQASVKRKAECQVRLSWDESDSDWG